MNEDKTEIIEDIFRNNTGKNHDSRPENQSVYSEYSDFNSNSRLSGTYRILNQIGAGGAGRVYLAEHLRLGKKVVLKADKRKLSTREDLLRREVDILKNLKHAYIPQVYDYFEDNGVMYTVMEYIEGESLDRPLKRGEHFSQPQLIRWMVQLLDALDYLHSPIHGTPPHGYIHSDIKPANLMRRSNGDLCLIDFNIALALGEEQAVGRSAGYASPEHYGLDFSPESGSFSDGGRTEALAGRDSVSVVRSKMRSGRKKKAGSAGVGEGSSRSAQYVSQNSGRKITPDIRSDIYSTGATFYHLLSGVKPSQNALDVVRLSRKEFSAPLIDVLERAMNPNPDLRWQTAAKMRDALLSLRKNDRRTVWF